MKGLRTRPRIGIALLAATIAGCSLGGTGSRGIPTSSQAERADGSQLALSEADLQELEGIIARLEAEDIRARLEAKAAANAGLRVQQFDNNDPFTDPDDGYQPPSNDPVTWPTPTPVPPTPTPDDGYYEPPSNDPVTWPTPVPPTPTPAPPEPTPAPPEPTPAPPEPTLAPTPAPPTATPTPPADYDGERKLLKALLKAMRAVLKAASKDPELMLALRDAICADEEVVALLSSELAAKLGCGEPPPPPLPATVDDCKNGGWAVYGVFKNQGDCVSYVVTKGKNEPGGK